MKTIEKNYYVCEICGKTSQSEEKIRSGVVAGYYLNYVDNKKEVQNA